MTNEIIQVQANNPETNAAINPTEKIPICELSKLISPPKICPPTNPFYTDDEVNHQKIIYAEGMQVV